MQLAAPTTSLGRYLQSLGRGFRLAPGKDDCVFIDHTDNYVRLGSPDRERVWSLNGFEDEGADEDVDINPRTRQVEYVEKAPVNETDTELTQITTDSLAKYDGLLMGLIQQQQQEGKSKGWIAYKLEQAAPPLEIWMDYARTAGHKASWAKLMHRGAAVRSGRSLSKSQR